MIIVMASEGERNEDHSDDNLRFEASIDIRNLYALKMLPVALVYSLVYEPVNYSMLIHTNLKKQHHV